jgi:hypothetical protein
VDHAMQLGLEQDAMGVLDELLWVLKDAFQAVQPRTRGGSRIPARWNSLEEKVKIAVKAGMRSAGVDVSDDGSAAGVDLWHHALGKEGETPVKSGPGVQKAEPEAGSQKKGLARKGVLGSQRPGPGVVRPGGQTIAGRAWVFDDPRAEGWNGVAVPDEWLVEGSSFTFSPIPGAPSRRLMKSDDGTEYEITEPIDQQEDVARFFDAALVAISSMKPGPLALTQLNTNLLKVCQKSVMIHDLLGKYGFGDGGFMMLPDLGTLRGILTEERGQAGGQNKGAGGTGWGRSGTSSGGSSAALEALENRADARFVSLEKKLDTLIGTLTTSMEMIASKGTVPDGGGAGSPQGDHFGEQFRLATDQPMKVPLGRTGAAGGGFQQPAGFG